MDQVDLLTPERLRDLPDRRTDRQQAEVSSLDVKRYDASAKLFDSVRMLPDASNDHHVQAKLLGGTQHREEMRYEEPVFRNDKSDPSPGHGEAHRYRPMLRRNSRTVAFGILA